MTVTPDESVTLDQLLGRDVGLPAVVRLNNQLAVVLDRVTDDEYEVWHEGRITSCSSAIAIEVVTDPALVESVLAQAVEGIYRERLAVLEQLQTEEDRQTAKLDDIRTYAIRRHEHGVICRGGLDDFLEAFDLAPYDPRCIVTFALQGHYKVQGDELDATRQAASEGLEVTASSLCGYGYGSLETEVTVTDAHLVTVDGRPQVDLSYTITGNCTSYNTDAGHVRDDAIAHLGVDTSHIPGLVAGSDISELHASSVVVEHRD